MANGTASEPDVFLSSAFRNFMDVRAEIESFAHGRVWPIPRDLDPAKGVPRFVIMDTLAQWVRQSKVFICVLRDGYGTSVFDTADSISFLEVEIYMGALNHANAHFFLMEPFKPDPRLKGLLDVVRAVRPGIVPDKAVPREAVMDGVRRVVDDTKEVRRHSWSVSLRGLVGELARARGYPKPDVEFFDKVFRGVGKRPNEDHLRVLLDDIASEENVEKRLTRMWVALRELSAAPYDDPSFKSYLPFWDRALGAWTSAAAWYGLHGHLYAGRLAGVNSLLRVREGLGESKAGPEREGYIHGTLGGRASEYYSMAKLIREPALREQYLELALEDVNAALDSVSGDVSGYLAIHGHIQRVRGRHAEALHDFEKMLRMRRAIGETGGIGEALADVALMHLRLGNPWKGRNELIEATARLDEAQSFEFAVRARKRLAIAHLLTGHPHRAFDTLCTAYEVAQDYRLQGQVTHLMELIHHLGTRLGLRKRRK